MRELLKHDKKKLPYGFPTKPCFGTPLVLPPALSPPIQFLPDERTEFWRVVFHVSDLNTLPQIFPCTCLSGIYSRAGGSTVSYIHLYQVRNILLRKLFDMFGVNHGAERLWPIRV